MRRLGSSNSLGALISICPSTEEKSTGGNHVYSSRGFQSMLDGLDEEDCLEESGLIAEKKRRLSVDQVKALEKNFEVENKLEPERKVKLAQELGLQPRQVAVWFQNRRARWKTKQLERDYNLLKAKYDDLKLNYDAIQHDKEALVAELRELKSKIQVENKESNNISIKEEKFLVSEVQNKATEQSNRISAVLPGEEPEATEPKTGVPMVFGDFKDGSSDSDTSAILNEESSPNVAISSSGVGVFNQQHNQLISPLPSSSTLRFNCSSSINCLPISDSRAILVNTQKGYQQQQQVVRMEEHNFFSGEDSCSFFSDDQAPTLQWYYSDQWS